jgi:Flp pilus assembly protein TadG
MRTKQNVHTPRRGAAAIELAFVLPVFFLMVLGVMEYGRFLMAQQALDNAARNGARYAVVNSNNGSTSQVQAVVLQRLAPIQNMIAPTIQVVQVDPATGANLGDWTAAPYGGTIAVQVNGTYTPMFAHLLKLPVSLTVRSAAMMTCEAN